MRVTLLGMVIEVSEEQPAKAKKSILVNPLGSEIEVSEVQPEKAY